MLTQEQIKNVLGSGRKNERILTDEDKVNILAMCENGESLSTIFKVIKEENEKVKVGHVREYLKRKLRRLVKDSEEK